MAAGFKDQPWIGRRCPRVEGVIGERIARSPEGLRETLNVSSVMGYEFIAQVIARVQKIQELELVKDLSCELEKRYLLVFEQGEIKIGKQFLSIYRFSHGLTQQYLYDELGAGERRMLHGEIAETLEAISADHCDQFALQLARHYDEAGNAEKAVSYWIMAGNTAFVSMPKMRRLRLYTRALELGKEITISPEQLNHLYTRRGRALELTGQFQKALKNYDEMLLAAHDHKDRRMELDAQVAASTLYSTPTAVMDPEKGQVLSEETLKLAKELGDQSIECRVLWNLLLANLHGSKTDKAIEYGERSLSLARSLNLREQIPYTLTDLGRAYGISCQFEESEARLIEAAGLWRELGDMTMLNDNLNTLLLNSFGPENTRKPLRLHRRVLTSAAQRRMSGLNVGRIICRVRFGSSTEEIDKALGELDASVRLAVEANALIHTKWYSANLCWAYIQIGAVQKGMDLYRTTRFPNQELPAPVVWIQRRCPMLSARWQPGSSIRPPPLSAPATSATRLWTMR